MPPLTLLQLSHDRVIEFPSVKLQSASVDLSLTNVSEKPVAYKIKTTAPKNYLVRPSTGVIPPGEEQEIQIILQPQQIIPDSNTDRFLVQAVEVDSTTTVLTKDFWVTIPKVMLQDHRLSVVFTEDQQQQQQQPPVSSRPRAESGFAPPAAPVPMEAAMGGRRPLPVTTAPPVGSISDFEAKYNDLLQYCLALDKQKTVVSNELNEMRQQTESLTQRLKVSLCKNCGGPVDIPAPQFVDPSSSSGRILTRQFELWRVVALIVAVVLVLKFFNFLRV